MVCITVWQKVPASTTRSMDCSMQEVKETLTLIPWPLGAFQQWCHLLVPGHVQTQKKLHLTSDNQEQEGEQQTERTRSSAAVSEKTSTDLLKLTSIQYNTYSYVTPPQAAGIQTLTQIGFGTKMTSNIHPGTEIRHHRFHATFFQKWHLNVFCATSTWHDHLTPLHQGPKPSEVLWLDKKLFYFSIFSFTFLGNPFIISSFTPSRTTFHPASR